MALKIRTLFLCYITITVLSHTYEVAAGQDELKSDQPEQIRPIYYPPQNHPDNEFPLFGNERYKRPDESPDEIIIYEEGKYVDGYGIGIEQIGDGDPAIRDVREAQPYVDKKSNNKPKLEANLDNVMVENRESHSENKGSRMAKCFDGQPCPINSKILIEDKTPNFNAKYLNRQKRSPCHTEPCPGRESRGGFPKPYPKPSRNPFSQTRFRRNSFDNGFRDFTPETNTRGSIYSSKSFGPESHGGWQTSAKLEHDFWKSNDGNQRLSGFAQHDRIDGGRFSGFRDSKAGIGYSRRFRRAPSDNDRETNNRITIQSSKTFGPDSDGGWQTSAKLEHDFWKSNDGNHRVSGFVEHDRIDGGRFGGFKDNKAGFGYTGQF